MPEKKEEPRGEAGGVGVCAIFPFPFKCIGAVDELENELAALAFDDEGSLPPALASPPVRLKRFLNEILLLSFRAVTVPELEPLGVALLVPLELEGILLALVLLYLIP